MTPEIASLRIGRSIRSLEADMDELLAKSADLLAEIARARAALGESARNAHVPMARVATMQRGIIDARLELVRAHRDLSRIAETMDIPIRCPDKNAFAHDGGDGGTDADGAGMDRAIAA